MAKIIILRGNSGSGKTSTAQRLHKELGEGTILVSQDVVRRQMLRVKDKVGDLSINLIRMIIEFGAENCKYVIVEGIFTNRKHGDMLRGIVERYQPDVHTYYFDIPFEETLKRHQHKDVDFGEEEMRRWFLDKDYLSVANEQIITKDMTMDDVVTMIMKRVKPDDNL